MQSLTATTGAVAHKMGRRWIMVELGEHCHTHIVPRLKKVIDGTDQGGISQTVDWQGGGGFRYMRLAPSLLKKDQWGNWVITLRTLIEQDDFFSGHYRGKVIEVHSNQSGEESDESMQRLLAVEHDEDTEIVIHVNKLKEGWDVTNLYTIVPLRASAAEILTEQTIGRGLRLPYGKRTGVDAIDRLCIIAHDRFQEIIDRANQDDSLIHEKVYIGKEGDADIPDRKPQMLEAPSYAELAATGRLSGAGAGSGLQESSGRYQVEARTPEQARVALATVKAVQQEARRLTSSTQLRDAEVQRKLVERVQKALLEQTPEQPQFEGLDSTAALTASDIEGLVRTVTEQIIELTIDVPQIAVLPTRDVTYGFPDFDLTNLDTIRFQPVSEEILLRHLENNQSDRIQWGSHQAREARPEDYLVRHLFARDEVDYDEYAGLLYKLAGQVVSHLRGYLAGPEEVENVLLYWQKQLSEFIWAQMQQQRWETPCDYQGKVIPGFDVLKPATFSLAAGEVPRHFRTLIEDKRLIRQMVFSGFSRCCYLYQKFDSVDGEWRLAQLLEDDTDVLKWMKPAPGQFRIEYRNGQNYEPDFVVETNDSYLIIEPKRADQLEHDDVKAKARAAVRWCFYANEHASLCGSKPWSYILVPDNKIILGLTVRRLHIEFGIRTV